MLHIWLIPLLIFVAVLLLVFYAIIRGFGGSGVRTEGRTVHDVPDEDAPTDD